MHPAPRRVPSAVLSLASLLPLAAAQPQPQPHAPAPAAANESPVADYTVHEWGTFTSMVDQHGVVLEGLHREEEALPPFVHDLAGLDELGRTQTKLPASHVTQKMETPVIYFHADAPLRVGARVWFAQGLMTQFFPLPTTVYPPLAEARGQLVDLRTVDGSCLEWRIDVVPRGAATPAEIPACEPGHAWQLARDVSAAFVRTAEPEGGPRRTEAEHYLFYRGIGCWTPPLALRCAADGVVLHNGMPGDVPFAAVLEIGERGARFALGPAIAAGAEATLRPGAAFERDRAAVARTLGAHVLRALVDEGLHHDEARAMVATWSRSWFESEGARVVYVLPRAQVDAVLPLSLSPRPKALVRVLVGRLEFITAERQRAVERALAARDAEALRRLDRFLEPHLRNVAASGSTPAVRALALRELAALGGS